MSQNKNTYECGLELNQNVLFVTNKNFTEYYLDEGIVYSIKFTIYDQIFIELQNTNGIFSCIIDDVFQTKEEADIKSPSRFEYYLNKYVHKKNYRYD